MERRAGGRSRYPSQSGPDLAGYLDEATRLRRRGTPAAARIVLERAVALARAAPGADRLQLVSVRRMLGEVLYELGDPAAAFRVVSPLVRETEHEFGHRHPATVRAVAVLGAVVHELGELDTAERMYQRVVDVAPEIGGPTLRSASLARVRLAMLHRDRGDLRAALDELTGAFQAHRERYGTEDADTVHIGAELAALHRAAGDSASARRVLTVSYVAAAAGLGEDNPLTRRLERELAQLEPPMPSAPVDLPGDAHSRSLQRRHDRRARNRRKQARGGAAARAALTTTSERRALPPPPAANGTWARWPESLTYTGENPVIRPTAYAPPPGTGSPGTRGAYGPAAGGSAGAYGRGGPAGGFAGAHDAYGPASSREAYGPAAGGSSDAHRAYGPGGGGPATAPDAYGPAVAGGSRDAYGDGPAGAHGAFDPAGTREAFGPAAAGGASRTTGAPRLPVQRGFPSRPGYADPPSHADRPGYADPPSRTDRPGYASPSGYADPPAYAEPPVSADPPGYPQRPGSSDPAGRFGRPALLDRSAVDTADLTGWPAAAPSTMDSDATGKELEPRPRAPLPVVTPSRTRPSATPPGRRLAGMRTIAATALVIGAAMAVAGSLALAGVSLSLPERPPDTAAPAPSATPPAPSPSPSLSPSPSRPPPPPAERATVNVRDEGATLIVSWKLATPAAVKVGLIEPPGEEVRTVANLPAGTTTHNLRGLNPRKNYCVLVRLATDPGPPDSGGIACTRR
ncbi:hypothetical protein Val02_44450 [Virgisporangium aliadipatigenens]|uniref:Tetratricopeptide repeat protein n=1 Tax=Virgisporangium aliadipatigenens TaxID=741659 RepID=A0A8J4DRE0_9ACTN|nr:hypothetical protein [Virgisporangium aliadipatigenens]GIJ47559.1 hypothetical protein Val02_44450 [Virgisporangium aliadipatigenens]